jgi:hypothetical protein
MKVSEALKGTALDQLIRFLDAQPKDEVFPTSEIEGKLNVVLDSGSIGRAKTTKLKDYTLRTSVEGRSTAVWGNKKAIAALRRQLNGA